jgi:hypothetical protein
MANSLAIGDQRIHHSLNLLPYLQGLAGAAGNAHEVRLEDGAPARNAGGHEADLGRLGSPDATRGQKPPWLRRAG